jgi:peptidoglycan hydrolase-like protein with peptidoglycan-binding domain
MSVIAYDFPVKDYIARLDATGHVTHRAFKKTSVTLHHNAGRLSHDGVLTVWKTRPASAHFDVDALGAVAQFVRVNEYAWACGNTAGNQSSIHIEMANSSLAPEWNIAQSTWMSAARLTAWLFARVIGSKPSEENIFPHHHWRTTACAGPFFDSIYTRFVSEVQKMHLDLTKPVVPSIPPQPNLKLGSKGNAVASLQRFLLFAFPLYSKFVNVKRGYPLVIDSDFGPQTAAWVKEFQSRTNLPVTGIVDNRTKQKMIGFGYKP